MNRVHTRGRDGGHVQRAGCINKLIPPPLSRSLSIIPTLRPGSPARAATSTGASRRCEIPGSGARVCVRRRNLRVPRLNTRCDHRGRGGGGRRRGCVVVSPPPLLREHGPSRQPPAADLGSNRPSLCELRSWIHGRSYFTATLLRAGPGLADTSLARACTTGALSGSQGVPRTDDSAGLSLRAKAAAGRGFFDYRTSSFHGKIRKLRA